MNNVIDKNLVFSINDDTKYTRIFDLSLRKENADGSGFEIYLIKLENLLNLDLQKKKLNNFYYKIVNSI